ncbi:hypothetical protein DICSQDRAFT_127964 [Dichomitus squalens LYAD-421 SS1]|uniref:Uncharacterized protein n=1 Tax=Dichomitus squalens (strain LYAD-421) TaxID=732165 RepID=R7SVU1_DICSQ|nr:uncharacterized protein DICSQDRAFT_127964 [Dichomitus squalens LYAD-421 SS1]EJF60053.1 hypothetical protein DICSQDRAFT_127964 [Dichomitus squalens LYAD-421 SS1]
MSSYTAIALYTFKTPGGRHFGRSERRKNKVVAEYRAWSVKQAFANLPRSTNAMAASSTTKKQTTDSPVVVVDDTANLQVCDSMVVDEEARCVVQGHGDACASPTEPVLLVEGSRSGCESGSQSAETPLVAESATLLDRSGAQEVRTTPTTDKVKIQRNTTSERRITRSMGQAEQDLVDEQEVERMLLLEDAVDDEGGNETQALLTHTERTDEKTESTVQIERSMDLASCLYAQVDEQQTMIAKMWEMQIEVATLAVKAERLRLV